KIRSEGGDVTIMPPNGKSGFVDTGLIHGRPESFSTIFPSDSSPVEPVEPLNGSNNGARCNQKGSIQELAFLDLKYDVENIRPGMEAETL
ncbi:unnamed protein product, partial [Laminaria digitata]